MTHVDKVDHDQSTDVAQAELACNLFGGFHVGFEQHLIDVL